jgi:hypothetical protein
MPLTFWPPRRRPGRFADTPKRNMPTAQANGQPHLQLLRNINTDQPDLGRLPLEHLPSKGPEAHKTNKREHKPSSNACSIPLYWHSLAVVHPEGAHHAGGRGATRHNRAPTSPTT